MAVGLVMRLPGVGSGKYDAIMQELGLPLGNTGDWPDGIISHAAGSMPDGTWIVVDVWESQEAFDQFLASRLGPAFEKVGGMPQPDVTRFNAPGLLKRSSVSLIGKSKLPLAPMAIATFGLGAMT